MSLKAGSVPVKPDLACVGMVAEIADVYQKEGSIYHTLPINIKGKFGGYDTTYYFLFQPQWFDVDFEPNVLLKEENGNMLYARYREVIADERRTSALTALAGDEFEGLVEAFDKAGSSTAEEIADIIRQVARGRDVGYVLRQQTEKNEETGKRELTERYNIAWFFPVATPENIKAVVDSAENPKRRRKLLITWDSDTPF